MDGSTGDPTRADYGFGLGVAVRTTPGIARMMGSVGDFSWPGASGTNWWVDPREELVVVWMAHSPGSIRWKYRQMIDAGLWIDHGLNGIPRTWRAIPHGGLNVS